MGAVEASTGLSPILRWQYGQLEQELRLLQGHLNDPTCPCRSSGEKCVRKHLITTAGLAGETASMDRDDSRRKLMLDIVSDAKAFASEEEATYLSPVQQTANWSWRNPFWARSRAKQVEGILVPDIVKVKTDSGEGCATCDAAKKKAKETLTALGMDVGAKTEKDINESVIASTASESSGTTTMVDMDYIKEEALGQFIGHSLHIAAKYADMTYFEGLIKTPPKPTDTNALEVLAQFQAGGLDNVDITKRYTFMMDLIGGAALIGLALQHKYGSGRVKELAAKAGVNLAINLEEPLINKVMGETAGRPGKRYISGYNIPQQFRVQEVRLSQPVPRAMAIQNADNIRGL